MKRIASNLFAFILLTSCLACSRNFPEPTTLQETTTIEVTFDDESLESLPINTDEMIVDALDRHHFSGEFMCGNVELVFDSNVRMPSVDEASIVTIGLDKERIKEEYGIESVEGVVVLSESAIITMNGDIVANGYLSASESGTAIAFIDYDNLTKDANSPEDSHWNDYEYITTQKPDNCDLSVEEACAIALAFTSQDLLFDYEPANVRIYNNNDPEGLGFYDIKLRAIYNGLPLSDSYVFYSTAEVSDNGMFYGDGRFYFKVIEESNKEKLLTLEEIINIFVNKAEMISSGGNKITVSDITLSYVPFKQDTLETFVLIPVWEFDYYERLEDENGVINFADKAYFSAIDGSKIDNVGYSQDE
ncbi:MAG: hypothetical protein MJ172_06200 [Clostridia bacterium]|nr:hypothetical protein [Clostridia bacterium]